MAHQRKEFPSVFEGWCNRQSFKASGPKSSRAVTRGWISHQTTNSQHRSALQEGSLHQHK
eukprot:5739918-Amphidinium_carterae.1